MLKEWVAVCLSVVSSPKENMDKLKDNPKLGHITTFGGHPVCCAASSTLNTLLEDRNIIQSVERKKQILKKFTTPQD